MTVALRLILPATFCFMCSATAMAQSSAPGGAPDPPSATAPVAGASEQEAVAPAAPSTPWRATNAIGGPAWLHFRATQRTRYENLWNQFRTGVPGNDKALSLRTTLALELRFDTVFAGAEFVDSRMFLADDNSPLDTTLINPIEPLQSYVGAEIQDLFAKGEAFQFQVGRLTLDVGSRRFVARNRFRNTINAFTGADAQWTNAQRDLVRLFATLPVQRLPDEREALTDSQIELDRESFRTVFWGAFYASREWLQSLQMEAYIFGLHERDGPNAATRNRRIFTPGLRIHRSPRAAKIDMEVEVAPQFGDSRATASVDDVADLDHLALFAHAALGYTVGVSWRPRLVLQYDYASGDADPDDGDNGRFDTLFGARRFEFGPTGIYGTLARSNVNSPGVRVEANPHETVDGFIAYRAAWLAESRDAWPASGVRDATGQSGDFIGHQLEARVRWRLLPENIALEVGFAHMLLGGFPNDAPNSTIEGDPTYVYSQLGFEI